MIYYRVGDTLPALRINVEDLGVPIDLTNLDVLVRWEKPDGTTISERTASVAGDPTLGQVDYLWQAGDLDQPGSYFAIVQLQPHSTTDRWSLTNPPLIEIDVLADSFTSDETFPWLPQVGIAYVSNLINLDPNSIDATRMRSNIERARRLAYVYGEFWRCAGAGNLTGMDSTILADLVALLAGFLYMNEPSVAYGPYLSQQYGSYQYELRASNKNIGDANGQVTGIPEADALINYFQMLNKQCTSSIDITYPEWYRNLIDRTRDPLYWQNRRGPALLELGDDRIW